MAGLDFGGLKPLDEVAPPAAAPAAAPAGLDFSKLKPIDFSGLQPVDEEIQVEQAAPRRRPQINLPTDGPRPPDAIRRGMKRAAQAGATIGAEIGLIDPERASSYIAEREAEIEQIPPPESVIRFGESKTFGDAWTNFLDAPGEIALSLAGESLGMTAPAMAVGAGAISMGGGIWALAGVSGVLSAAQEYSGKILDSFKERGIDTSKPEQVANALTNPELMGEIRGDAAKKGVAIGFFDALSARLGGHLVKGAKGVLSFAGRGTTELAEQGALGMSGEVAGELAAGEELQPASILAEGIAEIPGGVADVTMGTLARTKDGLTGQPAPEAAPTAQQAADGLAGAPGQTTVEINGETAQAPRQPTRATGGERPLLDENGQQIGWFDDQTGVGRPMTQPEAEAAAAASPAPTDITTTEMPGETQAGEAAAPPAGETQGKAEGPSSSNPEIQADIEAAQFLLETATDPTERRLIEREIADLEAEAAEIAVAPAEEVDQRPEPPTADAFLDEEAAPPSFEGLTPVEEAPAAPAPSTASLVELHEQVDDLEYKLGSKYLTQLQRNGLETQIEALREQIAEREAARPALDDRAGTRAAPVVVETAEDIRAAERQVATDPTQAQKEAENYKAGHIKVPALAVDVTIENPKGSTRSGTDAKGKPWSVVMPATYGRIKGTEDNTGDAVDIYIGDRPDRGQVFVVDQYNLDGTFDEPKVMAGFANRKEALAAYDAAFSDGTGPQRRKIVRPMSAEQFKAWLPDPKPAPWGAQAKEDKAKERLRGGVAKRMDAEGLSYNIKAAPPRQTFTTAKGSTYTVHPDGSTSRNKAFRPEHGEAEQGPQPQSETTFYVDAAGADALGLFQTEGGPSMVVAPLGDGRWGVRYTSGPSAGKFARTSVVTPKREPAVGLMPVEIWNGGKRVHFGNKITGVGTTESPAAKLARVTGRPLPAAKKLPSIDVMTFVARNGGVRDDEGHLLKTGRNLQRFIPGAGNVIRANGNAVDALGEKLWEAGYFGPMATTPRPTVAEVLDLLDRAARSKVYAPEDAALIDEARADEVDSYREDAARESIRDIGRERGEAFTAADEDAILSLMIEERASAEAAVESFVERLALQAQDAAVEAITAARREIPTSAQGSELDIPLADFAPARPEAAAGESKARGEAVARDGGQGRPTAGAQPAGGQGAPPRVDRVDDVDGSDEQLVVPGAEKLTGAEVRQAKVNERETKAAAEKRISGAQSKLRRGNQKSINDQDGGMFAAARAADQADLLGGGGKIKAAAGDPYYSALEEAAAKLPAKGTGAQMLASLKNTQGVKASEIQATGIDDWLAKQDRVSREEVLAYIAQNGVEIVEVVKGGKNHEYLQRLAQIEASDLTDAMQRRALEALREEFGVQRDGTPTSGGETKFASYVRPGGENYREVLLTLPQVGAETLASVQATLDAAMRKKTDAWTAYKNLIEEKGSDDPAARDAHRAWKAAANAVDEAEEAYRQVTENSSEFRAGHYDEPNVVAHIRLNDRTIDGKKVLFVEEIQSDWLQQMRRQTTAIERTVDTDFDGIVARMKKAGVLTEVCD